MVGLLNDQMSNLWADREPTSRQKHDLTFVTDVDAVAMCVPNESISPVFVIDGSVVVVGCVKPGFICVDSDRD